MCSTSSGINRTSWSITGNNTSNVKTIFDLETQVEIFKSLDDIIPNPTLSKTTENLITHQSNSQCQTEKLNSNLENFTCKETHNCNEEFQSTQKKINKDKNKIKLIWN